MVRRWFSVYPENPPKIAGSSPVSLENIIFRIIFVRLEYYYEYNQVGSDIVWLASLACRLASPSLCWRNSLSDISSYPDMLDWLLP